MVQQALVLAWSASLKPLSDEMTGRRMRFPFFMHENSNSDRKFDGFWFFFSFP